MPLITLELPLQSVRRINKNELVMQQINSGALVFDTQINSRYESTTAFRDVLTKIMKASSTHSNKNYTILKASLLETPLGPVIAVADERALFLLEFIDKHGLEHQVEKFRIKAKAVIIPGITEPINSIERELRSYFEGSLKNFKTVLNLTGTSFQELVWSELCQISYGETKSYAEQARSIERQSAYRAVANANGANRIAIVIPCHRIIRSNGELGGYGAGVDRKRWLLEHEQKNK